MSCPSGQWGVVRAEERFLGSGGNRDRKTQLNALGRDSITWLFDDADLPPNVLLHLPGQIIQQVMAPGLSGAERVRRIFRLAQRTLISRTAVETAAQQKDAMKRVRGNGGARTALAPEGIIILGQYESHRLIAQQLGLLQPGPGESISAGVERSPAAGIGAEIDGCWWQLATGLGRIEHAPTLPKQ